MNKLLTKELLAAIEYASNGDTAAEKFLNMWYIYCHSIDDLLDGEIPAEHIKEYIISLLIFSKDLYNSPFFLKNYAELNGIVNAAANAYADSVKWEGADKPYSDHADVLRSQGNDMLCAVAKIYGGFSRMRNASTMIRELSFKDQRNNNE